MDNYISARELYEWAKQREERAQSEQERYRFQQVQELLELVTKAADKQFEDADGTDNIVEFLK